jgi:serine/threonine-protein kinase
VDGQSLHQRLRSAGALPPELALRIAAEACSALSAAHQKGIVHRDIKPQNLLLTTGADGGESVKVIDFGIAKVREDAGLGFTGIMTATTGCIVCTPAYASPEQAQGMRGGDLDGRSDLYSLGLVLYEMLTGSLPFVADNPQALLWQRLQVQPAPLDRARSGLTFPPDLSRVVMKALERERENRYTSAGEMQRAIAAVMDSLRAERERAEARQAQQDRETVALESPPQPERAVPSVAEPKRSAATIPGKQPPATTNWIRWLGGAALLLILGIGLAIWLSRAAEKNPALPAPASQVGGRLDHGKALLRNGDYAGAIAEFKAVLQTDPGNAAAQAALRDAQSASGAEQSLINGTFDATVALRQASEKRAAGMYEEAINLYQSVLAHDASNRAARRGLADSRSALDAERKAFGK